MKNQLIKSLFTAAALFGFGFACPAHATIVLQGFDGGTDEDGETLFVYSDTIDGVLVNVTATRSTTLGPDAFANMDDGTTAEVTFTFSQSITAFSLELAYVRADEFTGPFLFDLIQVSATSITPLGPETLVETGIGTATYTNGTAYPADSGTGILNWTSLNNVTEITFEINTPIGARLGVMQYGFIAVPEPSTTALCIGGASAACVLLRRRRTNRF